MQLISLSHAGNFSESRFLQKLGEADRALLTDRPPSFCGLRLF